MHIPRLVIAGTHSGSGKTTVSTALMALLSQKKHTVLPFKVGPDYIDPAFHAFITGRPSRNLDSWLLPHDGVIDIFRAFAGNQAGELAVVEGVMGLYDGQGSTWDGSTAQVATILKAPVILVIDGRGMAASAAAMVAGFARFLPGLNLAGVICNRVSGPRHYSIIQAAILERTEIPCLGWLPANPAFSLPRRHLGLVQAEELPDLRERLHAMVDLAMATLDIDGLVEIARSAPALEPQFKTEFPELDFALREERLSLPADAEHASSRTATSPRRKPRPAIGVAKDPAFSFYYQDNLDFLESLGATLVPFSPLNDEALPENLDGLYLGGGFPEVFAGRLEANFPFRNSLRASLEQGLPTYAECGGMLYLCSSLTPLPPAEGGLEKAYAMTGFFPHHAFMTERLQNFGYVRVTFLKDCLLGPAGFSFRAHEFHYSFLELPEDEAHGAEHDPLANGASPVFLIQKPDGRTWYGGLQKGRVLAGFPHLHFHACRGAAAHFVTVCRNHSYGGTP